MDKIKVTKITIEIGKKKITLTEDEFDRLRKLLAEPEKPVVIPWYPYVPYQPYKIDTGTTEPYVTWSGNSSTETVIDDGTLTTGDTISIPSVFTC